MESASNWIHRNCRMDTAEALGKKMGTDKVIKAIGIDHVDSAHVVIYGAIVLTAILYITASQIRKKVPKATLSSRPRSPDPEKTTDNESSSTGKRVKPTERPPGSQSASHINLYLLDILTTAQHGNPATSNDQQRHLTQTYPQPTSTHYPIDLSATARNTTSP